MEGQERPNTYGRSPKNDYVRIQNRALGQERFTTKKDEEKTWGRTKYTKEIYQIIRVVTSQLFKNQYVLKDIETGQVATHPSESVTVTE